VALTTAVPQSQPLVDMFRLALNYNTIKLLSLGLSVVVEMELSDAWEIVIAQMKKQYCCRRGKNKKVSCL